MMLYVFHVDVGCMMNFDMSIALSSVENLKDTIERLHGIPAKNIVLLASGGEMLTQSTQVSHYSAGTDTNPIYMFLTGESKLPPITMQRDNDVDLREQVKRSLELPAVYDTVVTRAQLALRMYEMARDEERLCERLVHEQHLQQQGWSSVVANMEDLTEEFRQRFRNFCAAFDGHLEKRGKYLELLQNFQDDLMHLARIPILPGLMPMAEEDFHGFDEFLGTDEVFSQSHEQQESAIVPDATGVVVDCDDDGNDNEKNLNKGDGDNLSVGGGDEKSLPNKKLKMGNEQIDERTTILTTTICSTTTATITTTTTTATTTTTTTNSSSRRNNLNLLQWITSKENHNALKLMSEECVQGLAIFNEEIYESLKNEVRKFISFAEKCDIKEIKGLGDRLYQLELFKDKMKKIVQDQKELSMAFQQNQNRAINLRDASILPDLCATHQTQLIVMSDNHKKISDYSRCISKAKEELGNILHTRLRNIVYIENSMSELDNRALFYHRCLRRAEKHIKIIEQIHQAPCIYVAAVAEVVRRKIFSGEFRQWASKLSEDFDIIHSEEIKHREIFNASFNGHFLNILFPGMTDMPPAFANENPLIFDARLPNITKSDIEMLTTHLPELAPQIKLPDMGPVINFFVSRSGEHQKERMKQLIEQENAAAANMSNLTKQKLQADVIDEIKSETLAVIATPMTTETETETPAGTANEEENCDGVCVLSIAEDNEFCEVAPTSKSVCTSMSDKHNICVRSTETEQVLTQSCGTLTDTNEESILKEVERLRGVLKIMSKLSLDCINVARVNLNALRSDTKTYQEDLQSELHLLSDQWNAMRMQIGNEAHENQQRHERTILNFEEKLKEHENRVELLHQQKKEIDALHENCASMETQLETLRAELEAAKLEKEKAAALAREELMVEHKNEIESLRSRFKLMKSMDRSPSDMSLEKIERPLSRNAAVGDDQSINQTSIDIAQHETILNQLRAEADIEKERAIAAAVDNERLLWQSKILPMNSDSASANKILKDMLEDRERQLELFREKDLLHTTENYQLKMKIDALSSEESSSWLREKISFLNRDKNRLEEELNTEKMRRFEMENSCSAIKGSNIDQSSLTRSKSSGSSHKYISLESCSKGDNVFIVWSVRHCQFVVVQDSHSLFFVHADSLPGLNLRLPTQNEEHGATDDMTIPIPYYGVGRVIEKEYCQARKDENRYRVVKGSKFYRIKVAPLIPKQTSRRDRLESISSSVSRSITQCESNADTVAIVNQLQQQLQQVQQQQTRQIIIKDDVDSATVTENSPTIVAISTLCATMTSTATSTAATIATASTSNPIIEEIYKEPTINVTSFAEDNDEPVSLLNEHCRYVNVSEEEEDAAIANTGTNLMRQQQNSVITEQPTSSTKLKMDLLLASADITTTTTTTTTTSTTPTQTTMTSSTTSDVSNVCDIDTIPMAGTTATATTAITTTTTSTPTNNNQAANEEQMVTSTTKTTTEYLIPTIQNAESTCSTTIPTTTTITTITTTPTPTTTIIGTTSEDSDEFRSLECKDETDFPISE